LSLMTYSCILGWVCLLWPHDSSQLLLASLNALQANLFKKKGGSPEKEWWNNMKVKAVVIGILIVLGLVIWLSICHRLVCH